MTACCKLRIKLRKSKCAPFIALKRLFSPLDRCTSDNVGMNPNGKNVIKFGGGCRCTPTIHHEIMHAIGFWHEQSRLDRDEHVTILWDNIAEGE